MPSSCKLKFFFSTFAGLKLKVEGCAQSSWRFSNKHYQQDEALLEMVTYFFGAKIAEASTIDIGIYEFTFACLIPPEMPYSINKPNGYVSYDVAAKLDIPWRTDLRDYKSLTVYRREDLTFYPNSGMPLTHEKIAYFCCTFSCNTNQLTMTMNLPKLGFIAGEKIPVNITLVNESNTDIRSTTLILRRIFNFYVKSKGC